MSLRPTTFAAQWSSALSPEFVLRDIRSVRAVGDTTTRRPGRRIQPSPPPPPTMPRLPTLVLLALLSAAPLRAAPAQALAS